MNTEMPVMSDARSVLVDPVLLQSPFGSQAVLFTEVHVDDLSILSSEEGDWLRVLRGWDWWNFRTTAAQYYQALFEFNLAEIRRRYEALHSKPMSQETQGQATLRLLYDRSTGGNGKAPILHPAPLPPQQTPTVNAELLEPGVVPIRLGGRTPKCFFALTKAFLGLHLMGKSASAEEVRHHLIVSPPFARACGFTLPDAAVGYRHTDIPSLRKLEQFEQIMASRGLWAQIRISTVRDNILQGVVPLRGQVLVEDTTHYIAYSEMKVVEVPAGTTDTAASTTQESEPVQASQPGPVKRRRPSKAERRSARRAALDECRRKWRQRRQEKRAKRQARHRGKPVPPSTGTSTAQTNRQPPPQMPAGKPKRKSQSRTIKNCRCEDRDTCPHPWELSDPGAGTVVKGGRVGGKKQYWAHKAAVLSTGPDGVPLHAVPMNDAAKHDSHALAPHLKQLFEDHPELVGRFSDILADSAWDDEALKEQVLKEFGLNLRTPVNPRGIKARVEGLGRGMKSLSPTGTLKCNADREMEYLGIRTQTEEFLYGPPKLEGGQEACKVCPFRSTCCRSDTLGGRHVAVKFDLLPHINPGDPPMARRFKAMMRRRTAIERAIKRIKFDFGSDRLTRRGNDAFLAHLDRSLIAFHLMLRLSC